MLDLRQIEKYIDSLLTSTDTATNKMLFATLKKIKLRIESYYQTESAHYLLEIRRFIESIKLISLSSSCSLFQNNDDNCIFMGDILEKKNFCILTNDSHTRRKTCYRNGMPDLTLRRSAEPIFVEIYQAISRKLPISSIAWEIALVNDPENLSTGITNTHINDWQRDMKTIISPHNAVRDFRRDYRILGEDPKKYMSNEDAITQLQKLVRLSSYTDEEKKCIQAWMLAKAGQEMNFFISSMIRDQTLFTIPAEMLNHAYEPIISAVSNATDNSWELDDKNKIVFFQTYHIKRLQNGSECMLAYNDISRTEKVLHNSGDGINEYERVHRNASAANYYLVSISSHARLDIDETGTITPTVLSLNVTSQTNKLQPAVNAKLVAESIPAPASAPTTATAAAAIDDHHLQRPHSSYF